MKKDRNHESFEYLSLKQRLALFYFNQHIEEKGYPPTVREVQDFLLSFQENAQEIAEKTKIVYDIEIRSADAPSPVFQMRQRLIKKGFLEVVGEPNQARNVSLPKNSLIPPLFLTIKDKKK